MVPPKEDQFPVRSRRLHDDSKRQLVITVVRYPCSCPQLSAAQIHQKIVRTEYSVPTILAKQPILGRRWASRDRRWLTAVPLRELLISCIALFGNRGRVPLNVLLYYSLRELGHTPHRLLFALPSVGDSHRLSNLRVKWVVPLYGPPPPLPECPLGHNWTNVLGTGLFSS